MARLSPAQRVLLARRLSKKAGLSTGWLPDLDAVALELQMAQRPDRAAVASDGAAERRVVRRPESASTDTGAPGGCMDRREELRARIADIWRDVLSLDEVNSSSTFFDLGGTSLQSVLVQSRLRNELRIEVNIVDLFKYPSIRSLADHLAERSEALRASDRIATRAEIRLACRERQRRRPSRQQLRPFTDGGADSPSAADRPRGRC